ncbi:hypothetical protein ACPCHW_05640, partial [Pseudomonas siliginis]
HFLLAGATEGAIEQLAVVLAVAGVSHSFDPNPIGLQHKMKAIAGFFKPAADRTCRSGLFCAAYIKLDAG